MGPRGTNKRPAGKTDGEAAAADDTPAAKQKASPAAAAEKPAKRPRTRTAAATEADSEAVPDSPPTKPRRKATAAATAADAVSDSLAVSDSIPDSDAKPAPKRGGRGGGGGGSGKAAEGKAAAKGRAKDKPKAAGPAEAAVRPPPGPRYFLMKSEPEEFSLDDLAAKPNQTSHWEGVRNAQARNIMKSMKLGDEALFYHSSCKVPAAVGVVRVVREAYPDHFAFEKSSKYYDASSSPEAAKWWMVDVQLVRRLARPVTLAELRAEGARGAPIADMVLINKSRLSVQPVTQEQWARVLEIEGEGAEGR